MLSSKKASPPCSVTGFTLWLFAAWLFTALHTRLALGNERVVTARMQPSVVSPQECEAVSTQVARFFPDTCHLVKPHYVWKGYRRTVVPETSHGVHLAFSTPVSVVPSVLTLGNVMIVPRGVLSPHSATAPQAHSHGVLSCNQPRELSLSASVSFPTLVYVSDTRCQWVDGVPTLILPRGAEMALA